MKALNIMDGTLERLCGVLDYGLKWLAFCLMIGLSASALAEVFIRYLLPVPPRWAGGEVPTVLLVWVTAIGIVIAVRRVAHLRLDIMPALLAPRQAAALQVLMDVAALVFMAIFAWLTYGFTVDNLNTQMPGLGISYSWTNAALVFGAFFSVIYFCKRITTGLLAVVEGGVSLQEQAE